MGHEHREARKRLLVRRLYGEAPRTELDMPGLRDSVAVETTTSVLRRGEEVVTLPWCIKARDGVWCRMKEQRNAKRVGESLESVPTACDHWIVLPCADRSWECFNCDGYVAGPQPSTPQEKP